MPGRQYFSGITPAPFAYGRSFRSISLAAHRLNYYYSLENAYGTTVTYILDSVLSPKGHNFDSECGSVIECPLDLSKIVFEFLDLAISV